MRDGINVARYAIKLKSLATQRTHESEALEIAVTQVFGRGSLALCPGNSTYRFLDLGSLTRGRFTYFPVVPGRLEFAIEVRQAILRDRPQVVALELPVTLQPAWTRAVARLPEISVIMYPDDKAEGDQAVYVPVEPADPFTEAIRSGLEVGAAIVFVDPDAGQRPHLKDAYPDSYAVRYIGLARYIEEYRVAAGAVGGAFSPRRRGIAWKLQGTDPEARVMVVVSLNLLDPVLDAMEEPQAQPLARGRREGIELLNPHPESLAEILLEYPALQWRYENFRALLTDSNLIDRRHAQLAVLRAAEKEYEAHDRGTDCALAAPAARPVHAQSRPRRQRPASRHLRSHRGCARHRR